MSHVSRLQDAAGRSARSDRPLLGAVLALVLLLAGSVPAAAAGTAAPAAGSERRTGSSAAAVPGENGPIAFVVNSDIWYRSADGTFHQVTHGRLKPNWDLEVSPDGRRIAFTIAATQGVWVVNLNGTGLRNVTAGYPDIQYVTGYNPSWDPAGERLVFSALSDTTDNFELYVVGVDEPDSLRRLTQFGVGSGAVPAWNPVPGSNEIAFVPCCSGRIRTIDAETLVERWLTGPDDHPAWDIDWSPDGQRLAVEAYTDGRLYTVGRDGTDWVYLDPAYSKGLYSPSWSPDGTTIAVEGLDAEQQMAVLTVDAQRGVPGGITALTEDWGDSEFAPDWGPACTWQCEGTELTAKKKMRKGKLKVSGVLLPGVTGQKVKVSLVRWHKGRWKKVDVNRPRTRAEGRWTATFKRPKKGTCGVLAEFGGSRTHMPSWEAIDPFRC